MEMCSISMHERNFIVYFIKLLTDGISLGSLCWQQLLFRYKGRTGCLLPSLALTAASWPKTPFISFISDTKDITFQLHPQYGSELLPGPLILRKSDIADCLISIQIIALVKTELYQLVDHYDKTDISVVWLYWCKYYFCMHMA